MGIGDLQRLQDALDTAVLAPLAVKGVQDNVGFKRRQHLGQVTAGIDAGDPGDLSLEGVGALLAGRQGHLTLRGQPAHQDGDVQF